MKNCMGNNSSSRVEEVVLWGKERRPVVAVVSGGVDSKLEQEQTTAFFQVR